MDKRFLLSVLPLILLAAVLASISSLPNAHAPGFPGGPGKVCLQDASAASIPPTSPCVSSGTNPTPFIFNGPIRSGGQTGPTQIRTGVYINGSAGLNAFDITLLTNTNFLKPVGIDLTGTLLMGTPSVVLECISGTLIAGTVCSSTDVGGTIHLAAASAAGSALTAAPTTGLLFTAIFNITGTTAAGGVPLGFQTGCGAQTSIPDGTCVTIANGSTLANSETVQGASFDNSACALQCGWFAEVGSPPSLTVLLGSTTGNVIGITPTPQNGGPVLGSTSVTLTAVVTPGFIAPSFAGGAPSIVCASNTSCPMTVNTATAGTYFITVYESYVGDNAGGPLTTTYTLVGTATYQVNIQSVGWTVNGVVATSAQTANYAKGADSFVDVFTSLGGYTGSITLATSTCTPGTTGIACPILLPPTFTLSAGQTVTQLISFTSTAYGRLLYRDTMTASGLPVVTEGTATILINGYSMVSNTTSVSFPSGGTGHVGVTLTSLGATGFQFAGAVAIGSTSSPAGLSVTCSPTSVTLTAGGTATTTCSLTAAPAVTTTYTLTITGKGGANNAMTNSTATISVVVTGTGPAPDFTIAASSPATVNAGQSATSTITITALNGFTGVVTLTDTVPAGLTCGAITPGTVTGSGTATVSCSSTTAGTFTLTVTGTSGSLVHTATATFHFVDFTIAASSPAAVNTGTSATSTITITAVNGFAGVVTLTDTVPAGLTCGSITPGTVTGSGTATVSCSATVAGTYTLTVTGTSGSLVHGATATFTITAPQDFTIAASSPSAVNAGQSASSTITVTAVGGFSGVVSLTDLAPAGLTCGNITPGSVTGSGTATVSCSATVAGTYTLSITGTSASPAITHSTTATFNFVDFTIAASSPAAVNAGSSASSTITLTAVNGFSSVVTLTDTVPVGLTCGAITPGTVTGSGTATVSCSSTAAGTFTLTVTGTSTTLVHTATATFTFNAPQDFTIAASSPAAVNAGSSATSTITVAAVNGFAGVVTLTDTVPAGLTCGAITPGTVTGSGTATVSCSSTTAGTFSLTVTGTSGSLVHTAAATFHFVDFTVAASSPAAVNAGASATSTITVSAVNGFAGVVTLTDTVPSGLTCGAITSGTVTGSGTATVSCSSTTAGTFTLTATGTSGSLVHTATATFTFNAPQDFAIAASSPAAVNAGQSATSTITITSQGGFAGTVTLTDTIPTGLTCGAITPSSITGGSGTATVSCSATIANNYVLTITGTSGSLSHPATATFKFVDFSIAATSPASVNTGSSATSTITITAINGFTGVVTLTDTVPSGLTCGAITPGTVTGSGTATVACSSTTVGSFTLTLTGTSGSLSHSTTATFTFGAPADFTISATSPAAVNTGSSATSTITIAAVNGFTGVVTLTDTVPANLTCGAITPSSVTGSGTATVACSSTVAATYTLTITGTSGTLSHSTTATFIFSLAADFTITATSPAAVNAGSSAVSTITVTGLNGFAGTVSLTDTVPSGLSCGAITPSSVVGSGTATVSCSSTTAASFTLTVTGTSGSLTHSTTASFHFVDFTISATSPSSVSVGSSATSTISVAAVNGFTGSVSLTDTVPAGLTCGAITPASISGAGSATLACSSTTANTFTVTIAGTSGSLSHSATATFTFAGAPDFSISATSPAAVNTGASATSTITVAALNGFSGTVALTDTVPTGLTCGAITPSSVIGSGTAALSCTSTTPGTFTVTLTGTSGSLVHTATATFTFANAADFSIAANPTSVNVNVGATGASTITISPLSGFTGTVTLAVTTSSATLVCTLSSTSIAGGSGTSTLSCTGSSVGSSVAMVTGTSGSVTHLVNVGVTVNKTSPTLVTLLSSNSITVGNTVSDSATLTGSFRAGGTVTYSVFNGNICSAPGKIVSIVAVTGGVVPNSRLVTFNSTGDFGFQAAYGGDSNNNAAVSSCEPLTVSTNVSIRTTLSATTITVGGSVTDSATLAGQSATASGTVTYTDFADSVCAAPATVVSVVTVSNGLVPNSRAVTFNSTGSFSFQAVYSGDANNNSAISSCESLTVTSPTGNAVLLTFQGYDLDDFSNGISQLQVLVNGHLVRDIPGGLNNLTGTGDYGPYDNTWVNFGPFDITSFLVQGQNTILFRDPQTSDHFGLVKNVTIVQGNTLLLHVERARGVYPEFSFTYTFSIPPLVITSFNASTLTPGQERPVTFTAAYTGGTGPFRCTFSFGDGDRATVSGNNGVCVVIHHYDSNGTFNVKVTVRGASTSDLQSSALTVTVPDENTTTSLVPATTFVVSDKA